MRLFITIFMLAYKTILRLVKIDNNKYKTQEQARISVCGKGLAEKFRGFVDVYCKTWNSK